MAASTTLETTATADARRQTAGPWNGPVLVVEDLSQQRLPARRLVAIVRAAGLPADLVHVGPVGGIANTCEDDAKSLIGLAHRTRPRLIVFSILFADRLSETLGIIAALRKAGIGSHLALAGPLPSFAADELLAACPELDTVLCGEPEWNDRRVGSRRAERALTGSRCLAWPLVGPTARGSLGHTPSKDPSTSTLLPFRIGPYRPTRTSALPP